MSTGMNEIRIRIQCTHFTDHAKILRLHAAKGAAYARDIAELACGTSEMYIYPPGDRSPIFRCAKCGATLTYTIEELSTPQTWSFDGYTLRTANANDLELAREWTEADKAHAGLDPVFWLEQGPSRQGYLLMDAEGPVFFFKGMLKPEGEMEIFIQFPPVDPDMAFDVRYRQRARLGNALVSGTRWLEERVMGVVKELAFESASESLMRFCEVRLGFEEQDGKLRKKIERLPAAS